jgi:hypothetical protein
MGISFSGLQPPKVTSNAPILYSFEPNLAYTGQWLADYLRSVSFTLSVFTLPRQRPYEPMGAFSHIWVSITSLLLAGQAALFLLAMSRRFKR